MTIRPEVPDDHAAVQGIVAEAFAGTEFGHQGEADLVIALRKAPEAISLVAIEGDRVCGHILFTRVRIHAGDERIEGLGLAPMAVDPEWQGRGIGSSLVEAGLCLSKERDVPFVVVYGHPDYYPRFGFVPALECDLRHGFEGMPLDLFFVRILDDRVLARIRGGTARYREAFGPQD